MNKDVVAVVVTYNSAERVAACLDSLKDRVGEVTVVDNSSADDTCEIVKQRALGANLISNSRNGGFAAAVNQGIKASRSPFVLLLNPDAELETGVAALAESCSAPGVAAAAGKLVDRGGNPQHGFNVRSLPTPWALAAEAAGMNRLWPSNPINRRYRRLDFDSEREQDVEQPAGAFLMVRRDVLEKVGGLDEGFRPLWFEDVDLCRRILAAGLRIRYVPACVARHEGAHSLHAMTLEQRYRAWYGNLLRFINKHFSSWTCWWLRLVIGLGVLGRWLMALGSGQREKRKALAKVLRLVGGGHSFDSRIADTRAGSSSLAQY